MNSMKQMMTAIVENVEGMMKMESCGLAVMEVVKDGITSFVLVWMKRVHQKTFTVITAPTVIFLYTPHTLLYLAFIHVVLFIYPPISSIYTPYSVIYTLQLTFKHVHPLPLECTMCSALPARVPQSPQIVGVAIRP